MNRPSQKHKGRHLFGLIALASGIFLITAMVLLDVLQVTPLPGV